MYVGLLDALVLFSALQEVNFQEDVLVHDTVEKITKEYKEAQAPGEVERVQERDDEGGLISNDIADYMLAECRLCSCRTTLTSLRHHTRAAHGISIAEYKAQFGVVSPVERVLHKCGVCHQLILLDSDAVATHLRSGGHPKITHKNYNEKFMVDTRTSRRSVRLEEAEGLVVRKVVPQLVMVRRAGEPPSARATKPRKAKGKAEDHEVMVKDEKETVKDVVTMPKDSQKHFCCTLCDKKFKFRKMLKMHWLKCWPANKKRIKESEASDQRKRKVEDEKILEGTLAKKAKGTLVEKIKEQAGMVVNSESKKYEKKGEKDSRLKLVVKVGDQPPVSVVCKLDNEQVVDPKGMKMSRVMKKLRKQFNMQDAVFLYNQVRVGEDEPVEKFAGAGIQMV